MMALIYRKIVIVGDYGGKVCADKSLYADCIDTIDYSSQTALAITFSKGTFPEVCRYCLIGASQLLHS